MKRVLYLNSLKDTFKSFRNFIIIILELTKCTEAQHNIFIGLLRR